MYLQHWYELPVSKLYKCSLVITSLSLYLLLCQLKALNHSANPREQYF